MINGLIGLSSLSYLSLTYDILQTGNRASNKKSLKSLCSSECGVCFPAVLGDLIRYLV